MILRKPRRARSHEEQPEAGARDTWVALALILALVLLVVLILGLVTPAEAAAVIP